MRERVERLEQAITEAVKLASPALQQVINDLQTLRGIADISAVTIAAELGQVSRFDSARRLMGYCGAGPSEDSSGRRTRRRSITKTGNAFETNRRRSSRELSSSTMYLVRIAKTTGEYFRRGQRDCVEGTAPAAQAIHETGRSRQGQEKNHYCSCS
jgi:Transposase IS116/IS110/IS902 family